jgi:choline dehydrogenase-like flavoprotein
VSKILFDTRNSATGVKFTCGGTIQNARLKHGGEVIVTLGAIQSPQLLMISGIGPKAHLESHNIATISDRAGVGENLRDHPAANVSYQCPDSKRGISPTSKAFFIMGKKLPNPAWLWEWVTRKSGPLTSPGCDHGGFFRTSEATQEKNSPDLQMRFLAVRAVTADGMNSVAKFRDVQNHPDGFSFQNIAARPHSEGRVRLASSSMADHPVVEGNYLSDPRDVATLREGLKLSRRLAKQDAFKDFVGHEVFPGPEVKTDEQLDAYISESVHTANALVGTCRMGCSDDPLAVCDSEMRVLGVHNLRVCDASVMPKLPGCQTGAPTVMIAERAAEAMLRARSAK